MEKHWEKLLNPELLRHNLISASVYISAYEICRSSVISPLQGFFADKWESGEAIESEEYRSNVLSLAPSPLEASLVWFKDMGAIDNADIETFSEARKHRNKIAHRLPEFLSDSSLEVDQEIFSGLTDVTHKIGVWWAVNVEIPTSSEWDGVKIDETKIKTGVLSMLQVMMDIAFGNEPEEGYYYKHLQELSNQTTEKKSKK